MRHAQTARAYPKRMMSVALAVVMLAALVPFQVVSAFAVPATTTWYVDGASGDDLGAGTSEDPLETLEEAVYVRADDGDTILVRPGTYGLEELEIIDFDGLTIASTNGASATILDGDEGEGAVMAIVDSSDVLVEGFTITRGSAPWAGGAYLEVATVTFSNCDFEHNMAEWGGAIAAYGTTLTVTGCDISNNFAFAGGAGIEAVESTVTVIDSEFADNGDFWFEPGYTEFGGAMDIYESKATIDGTTFDGNVASGGGGVMTWASEVAITESVFTNNEAWDDEIRFIIGAEAYLSADSGDHADRPQARTDAVEALQVEWDPNWGFGGGLATYDGMCTVSGSEFSENFAMNEGGGIFAGIYSFLSVSDSLFDNNDAEFGGAISYDEYNYYEGDILGEARTDNWDARADVRAAVASVEPAFELNGVPAEVFTLERSVFTENFSMGAPAVYFDTDHYSMSMDNCLFAGNRSDYEGVVAVFNFYLPGPLPINPLGLEPEFEPMYTLSAANNTFADNIAGLSMSMYGRGGTWDVRNTVAWGNTDSGFEFEGPMDFDTLDASVPEESSFTYCDLEYGWSSTYTTPTLDGDGNFSADPMFDDDYALTEGSPCIDTGTDVDAPMDDIVGWTRPVDGDNDTFAAWDIGAYEFFDTLVRDWGTNRYATAVRACQMHFDEADTVIVATGEVFADGLSAAGLAGSWNAPILLSPKATMPALVMTEIERLGATHAIVVGGTSAVADAVADDLDGMGLDVDRIGGADRYETAAMVAQAIADREGEDFSGVGFVARGDTFPDALSVSPIAYAMKSPILLVRPGSLPDATVDIIEALDFDEFLVAGGPDAVGSMAVNALDATTVQVGGLDRYDTSAKVSDYAIEQGWAEMTYTGIATGEDFPDALTGGAALGVENGVLLLTPYKALHSSPKFLIEKRADEVLRVEVLGGESAVSDTVWATLHSILD